MVSLRGNFSSIHYASAVTFIHNLQFYSQSKGGILAKACEYIQELRANSARLPDVLKENERLNMDLDLMRQQCDELKNENQVLRAHLQQQGATITTVASSNS